MEALKKGGKKEKYNPDDVSVRLELGVGFWAGQCNSVLLLFLYGLYCDTALGTLHYEHHHTDH